MYMNDETQQSNTQPHLLHSLVLIFLETVVTFILKHDRGSRIHAKVLSSTMSLLPLKPICLHQIFLLPLIIKGFCSILS